ncbi:MAG: PIN domain-containing protein [Bacteroidota bacterium]
MKKIFLDANVLVSVIKREYPVFPYAARVMSLADNKKFKVYTSATCLAIAFYFAEKKRGTVEAKKLLTLLAEKLMIADCGRAEVVAAAANKKVLDFEDGLEYYAALHAGCTFIVSEDVEDFYFSEMQVMRSEDFLRQIVL